MLQDQDIHSKNKETKKKYLEKGKNHMPFNKK